ncbi:MAG TPA: hypothetical protein VIV60_21250, partial [Polyangiaceae bacterium]
RLRATREMWGPHPNRPMLMLMRRLGLSREQQDVIEKIIESHEPKRRTIMQTMMDKCGQELVQEKSDLDREIRATLTAEQQARFDEISNRQRERFFGHRHVPAPHD